MARVSTAAGLIEYMKAIAPERRGLNVYNFWELQTTDATTRTGARVTIQYQRPLFSLRPDERTQIVRFSAMVLGIVNSRMQRAGSLEWNVISINKDREREAAKMKDLRDIWTEYADLAAVNPSIVVMRSIIYRYLHQRLMDLRPDMANFSAALRRWEKRGKLVAEDRASEIEDWLHEPNQDDSFDEFIKKWVNDLHTHGAYAVYKEPRDGVLENFYGLPGGSVLPIHNKRVGGATGYLQFEDTPADAQLYFNNEVCYSRWLPSTAMSYGMVPLEALVNKVAEQLMFDQTAANQADGTKPPEKAIIFGRESPFGDLDGDLRIPLEPGEQTKLEAQINEARKGAIRVLTGTGTPLEIDLSRSDLFQHQSERQRQLKEDAALVFGATPMEMNLSGSADTSGRSTSESQERMEQKRGLNPVLYELTSKMNREIIPYRFGWGYRFQFASGLSEAEQIELWSKKLASGVYGVNEIRTTDAGEDPYPEEEYDRPNKGAAAQPGENAMNPLYTSPLNG